MTKRRSTSVRGSEYIVHLLADDGAGKSGGTLCKRKAESVNCCCSGCGRWDDVCRICQDNCLLANIKACVTNADMRIVAIGDVVRRMNVSLVDLKDTFVRLHMRNRINICATLASVAKNIAIETIDHNGTVFSGVVLRT